MSNFFVTRANADFLMDKGLLSLAIDNSKSRKYGVGGIIFVGLKGSVAKKLRAALQGL